MNEYLKFSERLGELDPQDASAWIEQSYAHNSLGSLALAQGDAEGAARAFAASVALKARALARAPDDKSLAADLADSLSWSARAEERRGELAGAAQLYQRELAIVQQLHAASPSDALYTNRLAHAHTHVGELQLTMGQTEGARGQLQEAERLLGTIIAKDPSNKAWQASLATVSLKLLDLDAERAAPATQLAALGQLHASLSGLSELQPKKILLRRLIAMIEQRQAAQWARQHQDARAGQLAAHVIDSLNALRAQAPDDALVREALVNALLFQATLAQHGGRTVDAVAACQSAQALLPAAASSHDYHILAPWVRAHHCAGKEDQASQQRALLRKMAYREPVYMRYVESPPTHEGS